MKSTGIIDYLRAGYSHFYLRTDEASRAIALLKKELTEYENSKGQKPFETIKVWGITVPPSASPADEKEAERNHQPDPMAPLTELKDAAPNTVLILKNYHWFLKDEQSGVSTYHMVQWLQDRLELFRSQAKRKILIVVSPVSASEGLPKELVREFVPLRFELPDAEEIETILDKAITVGKKQENFKGEPDKKTKERLIANAKGLQKQEIENSYFLSLVKAGELDPMVVSRQRAKFLEGVAGIKFQEYDESFDSLQGYGPAKEFVKSTINSSEAKGIMLLGPPGTGKSHFAKAVANMARKICLTVEMAEWSGKYVGETESKVLRGIDTFRAIGDCVGFIDEIEKGLAGVSGKTGGVRHSSDTLQQRAFAPFLKFMGDPRPNIYLIATCNNISALPPEYVRAERWDTAPWFIDLPNAEERLAILKYYIKDYKVKGEIDAEEMHGWSGAEIKALCRLAHIMKKPIEKVKHLIVPISDTMSDEIEELRDWAKGRTLAASEIVVNGGMVESDRAVEI